ncbi:MAG: bifunctional hydroxymethylpyrimidine kinase/phosphomethylpyrimidine kinase [Candidatus Eremiobacteraeota bacterium]|nr:bifunctional hydroxymethylpyrimidine kinase/phosphomethylpyrimidine kinase [Candidatus Eremiobacteraeota bacterium]MBV9055708.1 bifunctional hydroxymethylpyrimidine kinase/phosphomethylpyrimidine kinase [Candidatus Eremiobacteraeota bacterium]MBV9699206.1 bifunctional hydroxymethylpyrimidine kinase/phosphomethylpyrimidine kinase [Candidatus Eremiobacteraeota bacterium]
MAPRPIVLSIGTTHPWNVAGTGRDLIVGVHFGVRVFTAVAAVSAQGPHGVTALQRTERNIFQAQLATLPWESAQAARVGALASSEAVEIVAEALRVRPELLAVVDPAFAASRGGELVDAAGRIAYRDRLAVLGNVILTPNLAEAAELLGVAAVDASSIGEAAAELRSRGCLAVLVKGGHLDGAPTDVLAAAEGIVPFTEPRIAGQMHGTGCSLAMALACELAAGKSLLDSVRSARAYVRSEIAKH